MNCEKFESLLADALGDELSPGDRPVFEEHLASCERCRREYETSHEAVTAMRTLPGPQRVSVRREGNRLVIVDDERTSGTPRGPKPAAWWASGVFRYAASVLIAFTAGYIAHAALGDQARYGSSETVVEAPDDGGDRLRAESLEVALVSAYTRKAGRSDLATAFIAMAKPSH